jgi:putative endonuclease
MKAYMYILVCSDGSYYVGSTTDLGIRLIEHQNGIGANFTSKHLPVRIIYFEEFQRIEDAFQREKQIQGWSRKKKEALMSRQKEELVKLSRNYTQFGVPKKLY